MIIRPEQPDDIKDIRDINEKAFGHSEEADIIDSLRNNCADILQSMTFLSLHQLSGLHIPLFHDKFSTKDI